MSDTTDHITSEENLRKIVREEVTAVLKQFSEYPDAGMQINNTFKKQLEAAAGVPDEDLIPFSEIKEQNR